MATRFYFPATVPGSAIAPTVSSLWRPGVYGSWPRPVRIASFAPPSGVGLLDNTAMSRSTDPAESSAGSPGDVLIAQYISDPIAAQTISGTIKGLLRVFEGFAGLDARAQLLVKVVSGDGSTTRGVLYGGDLTTAAPDSTDEWFTSYSAHWFLRSTLTSAGASPVTLTSVSALAGDRIVLEVGARCFASSSSNLNWDPRAANTTDLVSADATVARSWLEFSQTIATDQGYYYTDFSEYAVAGRPANWTIFGGGSAVYTVTTLAGATGGVVLRRASGGGTNQGIRRLGIVDRTDDEVRVKVKVDSGFGGLGGPVLSQTGTTATGYCLQVNSSFAGQAALFRNGTQVVSTATGLAAVTAGVYYWLHIKRTGNLIQGKIWRASDSEPASFHVSYTDGSPLAAGGVGYMSSAASTIPDIDIFQQGTASLSASITVDAPGANVAQALAPTLNLVTSVSVDLSATDPAGATASAFDPDVTAIIRQDVTIDLSAVPMSGATVVALDAIAGIGPSIPVPVVGVASGSAYVPTIAPIDRVYTDFHEYSTNAAPSGWTVSDASIVVQESITGATGAGEKALLVPMPTANTTRVATWDGVGNLTGGTFQIRVKGTALTVNQSGATNPAYVGVIVGGNGPGGYRINFSRNAHVFDVYILNLTTGVLVGGAALDFGSATVDASTWVNFKVSTDAGQVRTKIWIEPATEPTLWTTTRTYDAQATGFMGVFARNLSGIGTPSVYFDTFEWNYALDRVPDSKVSLRSQVLPLIQKNLGLRWKATNVVDRVRSLVWAVELPPVPVQTSVSLAWTGVQQVQASAVLRWGATKEVVTSRALRWVFSQEVDQRSRDLRWRVRTLVETKAVDLRWGAVHTVDAPTTMAIAWGNTVFVEKKVAIRFTTQSEGRVTKAFKNVWNTLVTMPRQVRTRWGTDIESWGVEVEDFSNYPLGPIVPDLGWRLVDTKSDVSSHIDTVKTPDYFAKNWWVVTTDPTGYGSQYVDAAIPVVLFSRVLNPQEIGLPTLSQTPVLYFVDEPDPWEHDVVARVRPRYNLISDRVGNRIDKVEIGVRRTWQDPYYSTPDNQHYTLVGYNDFVTSYGYTLTLDPNGATLSYRDRFEAVQTSDAVVIPGLTGWLWTRFQVRRDLTNQITQAKAKVWRDGAYEPKNWTLSITVNSLSSFPIYADGQPILTGATGQVMTYARGVDLDRASWVTPSTKVVLAGPATATFAGVDPVVALRTTIRPDSIRATFDFLPVIVDIGDNVVVSWLALEIPEAVLAIEVVEVEDLGSASVQMLAPTVTAGRTIAAGVESAAAATMFIPTPTVTGHSGIGIGLDSSTPTIVAMPAPEVRVVAFVAFFPDPITMSVQGLAPTLTTEFNARAEAPVATASFRAWKPDSVNGSREVDVDFGLDAGFSMIPVQAIIATLSIPVDNATLAQMQMLPADARLGLSVSVTNRATASASALVPTVQTSVRITTPVLAATFRARDTLLTRTTTRFSVGVTALVYADFQDPVVQVFFQRVDVHPASSVAFGLFSAVAPEFLSTPAEIGDALVLTLGSTVGEVRLGHTQVDVQIGSMVGEVAVSDVRDEERV